MPNSRLDLEELAVVDEEFDQLQHVVRPGPLAWNDAEQRFLLAVGRIVGRLERRLLIDVLRHVAEKRLHLIDCVVLVRGSVVDRAGLAHVDVGTAELVLGHFLAERSLDQRRTTGEERALGRHHGEVSEHRSRRDPAGGRARNAEDERHFLSGADVGAKHIETAGQVAVAVAFSGDIGAGAFVEDEQRHAVLTSHVGQK